MWLDWNANKRTMALSLSKKSKAPFIRKSHKKSVQTTPFATPFFVFFSHFNLIRNTRIDKTTLNLSFPCISNPSLLISSPSSPIFQVLQKQVYSVVQSTISMASSLMQALFLMILRLFPATYNLSLPSINSSGLSISINAPIISLI